MKRCKKRRKIHNSSSEPVYNTLRETLFHLHFTVEEKGKLYLFQNETLHENEMNITIEEAFPEDYSTTSKKYRKTLNKLICEKFSIMDLYNLMGQKRIKNKKFLVDDLISQLFNIKSDQFKREFETQSLIQYEEAGKFFFHFSKFPQMCIPQEIIDYILSFMTKDFDFLNSVGLVNEFFYISALRSWTHLKINGFTLYKIPLICLKNVTFVEIDLTDICVKDLIYIGEHVQNNLKSLYIENKIHTFFRWVVKYNLQFKELKKIYIREDGTIWCKLDFPPLKHYPKIENLCIPGSSFVCFDNGVFKNLKTLFFEGSIWKKPYLKIVYFSKIHFKNLKNLNITSPLTGCKNIKFKCENTLVSLRLDVFSIYEIKLLNVLIFNNFKTLKTIVLHFKYGWVMGSFKNIHLLGNLKNLILKTNCKSGPFGEPQITIFEHLYPLNTLSKHINKINLALRFWTQQEVTKDYFKSILKSAFLNKKITFIEKLKICYKDKEFQFHDRDFYIKKKKKLYK